MFELDCHLTKDNQVVVNHDFALDRTTNASGFIRDTDYDVSEYQELQNKRKNCFYRIYRQLVHKCNFIMIQVKEKNNFDRKMIDFV